MTRTINILLLLTGLMLMSCTDEYWPELDKYEDILVIDGAVTNAPAPYEIRVSVSTSVQDPQFNPYTGAQVTIIDDEGVVEDLTEILPGHYQTAENGMQGVIGKSYKISVTANGKVLESEFQKIIDPVGLNDVYAKVEVRQTEDELYNLQGYQFYLDTEEAKKDTNYLMWRVYGTFKYRSEFLIRYIWDGKLNVFPQPDSLYVCYSDDNIDDLFVMSTIGLSSPIIKAFPLNFVNTETRKLSVRYSLLVKQFSLNKNAFDYFERINSINGAQETLYTEQPYQVRGNIFNNANPDELVLGYFLVGGVAEKRIYVERPSFVDFYYSECVLTQRDFEAFGFISWTDRVSWPLFVTTNPEGVRALPVQGCIDCREAGGTLVVPGFWED